MAEFDLAQIIFIVLTSAGGIGAIIVGISKFISDFWLQKNIESQKLKNSLLIDSQNNQFQLEVERKKSEFELEKQKIIFQNEKELEKFRKELEIQKEKHMFFNKDQYEIYQKIFSNLYQVKAISDKFWDNIESDDFWKEEINVMSLLGDFSKILAINIQMAGENALLIEDEHYKKLFNVFNELSQFSFKKHRFVDLYLHQPINEDVSLVKKMLKDNKHYKMEYDRLIEEIRVEMMKQIR